MSTIKTWQDACMSIRHELTHLEGKDLCKLQVDAAVLFLQEAVMRLEERCETYRTEREAERDAKEALSRRLSEALGHRLSGEKDE